MPYVAQAMAEVGDLDGALGQAQTLGKFGKLSALRMIIDSFADDDFHGNADAWGGIEISIGAESMSVKDRAATTRAMPTIAQFVRDTGDSLLQARMLSVISNLQAKAGDFVARTPDSRLDSEHQTPGLSRPC